LKFGAILVIQLIQHFKVTLGKALNDYLILI